MRLALFGSLAVLALLQASPVFAQSLDDIVKAEKSVDDAWTQSPLRYRQYFFVDAVPTGFGMYEKRAESTFKQGEKLIVYAEPAGYGWKDDGDGTYSFGFDIDLAVKSKAGDVLTSQKNFSHVALTSHAKNHEFMLAITLDLSGADPGDYVLEYTTRDIASDKSAVITLPFSITAP
jgi:hypothetical protein